MQRRGEHREDEQGEVAVVGDEGLHHVILIGVDPESPDGSMVQNDRGVSVTLVPSIDELDVTWLSSHLGLRGVTNVAVTSVGQGQVANCYRLTSNTTRARPASSRRCPRPTTVSRSTAALQHLYEREVSFYQHLATSITTRTPHCYFAERDDTDNFLLLLEDLSPSAVDRPVRRRLDSAPRAPVSRRWPDCTVRRTRRTDLHDAPWLRGVSDRTATAL